MFNSDGSALQPVLWKDTKHSILYILTNVVGL